MKVLLGPTNFANQPVALMQALRARGIDAHHVLYAWNRRALAFGYDTDRVVSLDRNTWPSVQLSVLEWAVEERFEIFHLWNRSLVGPPGGFGFFNGLDLPFIRASGGRIVYRFTGYDLRRRSLDMELNPYSPFHAGFEMPYDEQAQADYVAHLRSWVDCFVVQDPEMQTFMPEAEVIPRGIDLSTYGYVGVEETTRPLIVHAPSNPGLKGTEYVERAVEALRDRGHEFTFKLITGMSHTEAREWCRRADVVIDQLLIGWYGVLAIEAMALGKPVVAYVREPLSSSFEPALPIVNATPADLADRLGELIGSPTLRVELGRRGREFAEAVHDIRLVAEHTESLYHRVLSEGHPEPRREVRYLAGRAIELQELLTKARQHDRTARELADLRNSVRLSREGPAPVSESREKRIVEHLTAIEKRAQVFRRTRAQLDAAAAEEGEPR